MRPTQRLKKFNICLSVVRKERIAWLENVYSLRKLDFITAVICNDPASRYSSTTDANWRLTSSISGDVTSTLACNVQKHDHITGDIQPLNFATRYVQFIEGAHLWRDHITEGNRLRVLTHVSSSIVNRPRTQCLAVASGTIGESDLQILVNVITVSGSLNARWEVVLSTADRYVWDAVNYWRLGIHSEPVRYNTACVADCIDCVCGVQIFSAGKVTPGVRRSALAVNDRLIDQREGTADGARSGVTAGENEDHQRAVGSWWWCRDESQSR